MTQDQITQQADKIVERFMPYFGRRAERNATKCAIEAVKMQVEALEEAGHALYYQYTTILTELQSRI